MLLLLQLPIMAAAFTFPTPTADEQQVRAVIRRISPWVDEMVTGIAIVEGRNKIDDGARIIPSGNRVDGDNGIYIEGGSGPSILYALNYYLRNYCNTQITWDGTTYGDECEPLTDELYFKPPPVRYFGNQVTFGYSFVWWTWAEWEKFIDWLALNGFNAVLAPIGQEAIWRDLYMEMGVPRSALNDFFTAPTFLPWHRMGNLKAYGGAPSDSFLDAQLQLNKLIVARLASLGITPILPTFAGFVPDALTTISRDWFTKRKLIPDVWQKRFERAGCWGKFNETWSCLTFVRPGDDLYRRIGKRFIQMQADTYGRVFHVYSADPVNELGTPSQDYKYLRELSWSIHTACMSADERCIWVFQSWTFSYDKWPKQAIKAFLGGVPLGGMLVLDLYAEHYPLWSHTKSFYGHPFVWTMLHNFGGNGEIRGNLRHPNKHYQIALTSGSSMVGGGLSMEAIHQNYVQYQFMIDRIMSPKMIDVDGWIQQFAISRYQTDNGTIIGAWKAMLNSFYSEPVNRDDVLGNGTRFQNFIYKRPRLVQTIKYWFPIERIWQIKKDFENVTSILDSNILYRMDFNDIKREVALIGLGNDVIQRIAEAFGLGEDTLMREACILAQNNLRLVDQSANYDFDEWMASSNLWASSATEKAQFERNTRDLVSTWGPTAENIDYAHRTWKGLMPKYYAPRWNFLCRWLSNIEEFGLKRSNFSEEIFYKVESRFVEIGDGRKAALFD